MKEIRIGLIGCGAIAPTHIYSYRMIPGATVKTVCDLNAERARKISRQFSVAQTQDYHDLLNDPEIDLIDVCTDHFSHAQLTADALDAGKDVVCEKCLAANFDGVQQMLDAHKRNPDRIFAGIFQHRHESANRLIRSLIDRGYFGTMLTASAQLFCNRPDKYYSDYWHGKWNGEGGSVLMTQVVHFIDLLDYFLDAPEAVVAKWNNLAHQGVIETEDTASALVRYGKNVLATITANSACSIREGFRASVVLSGTHGHVELSEFRPDFWKFDDPAAQKEMDDFMAAYHTEVPPDPNKPHYGGGHPAQLADVIDAVRNRRTPYVTGEQAAVTAKLIQSCYLSQQRNAWVDLC